MTGTIKLVFQWFRTWKRLPVFSWIKAAALYRDGNYEKAEALYRAGLEKHPKHPAQFCARLDLAYCLFKRGALQEAEAELKIVVKKLPDLKEGYLRLARLQMWSGHALEAAWTMRRALKRIEVDADLAALFLLTVLESDGPLYLLKEAVGACRLMQATHNKHPMLNLAQAYLQCKRGDFKRGLAALEELTLSSEPQFEAVLVFAEMLLKDGRVERARKELKGAMKVAPEHPRILSLFAESYLKAGETYKPEYAQQLATAACQKTAWQSPREMHVLAESYYHINDRMSALIMASKAKEAGSKLLTSYSENKILDQLIDELSSGTLG